MEPAQPRAGRTANAITVTALNHYPIKSCAGTALTEAALGPRGILHDREFVLVEAATGTFLTQRELPPLALIRPTLTDGRLHLAAPEMPPLTIPIATRGDARDIVVWRDTCPAIDQGPESAAWFTAFLGLDCRLMRMAEDHQRQVDPAYAEIGDQVGFADGFPVLLISEESLADLNSRLETPLPMNRFRPNVVVAGAGEPYQEDGWTRITIGEASGVAFRVVKSCARCAITTTDQATAARGKEPLRTLATYRKGERGVYFGQNLIHDAPGTLRLGDVVRVTS
ncbi:MAG: MOSC domain-containing protein [Chloroflexia bacterium]|nr:MOSC domain-containing protein [Chloroflexia bacterium]